jgi:hypothetical protein
MNYYLFLKGGLGNQIFILIEAIRLKKSGFNVSINDMEFYLRRNPERPLVLDRLFPDIYGDFSLNPIVKFLQFFFFKLYFKLNKKYSARVFNFFISDSYHQYIDSNSQYKLIESLTKQLKLNPKYKTTLAVHIRRGDYKSPKHNIHGLIDINSIIDEIIYAYNSCNFFSRVLIFSDSIEEVKNYKLELFLAGLNVEYDNESQNSCDVFLRIAACGGVIAANSTFSVLAGLFNEKYFFSIPNLWTKKDNSYTIGLKKIRRYPCTLQ